MIDFDLSKVIPDILYFLLQAVFFIVNTITQPLSDLMVGLFPALGTALSAVASFITTAFSAMGWVLSLVGIPFVAVSMVATLYVAKLTVPALAYTVKLGLKWYKAIKP